MQLKLQRSQRTAGFVGKSIVFCLDARVDLTPEEAGNVRKYALGKQVIYNSENSRRHLETAKAVAGGAGTLVKVAVALAMAKLSLNITIEGLTAGQHIECKDLDELLGAEEAIMEACKATRGYLDTAATFDGRETVIDFGTPEPSVAPASTPARSAAAGPWGS